MVEVVAGGLALQVTVDAAVSVISRTVQSILAIYKADNQLNENRAVVNALEGILGFLGPAVADIQSRAAQLASSAQQALTHVAGVILEQNRFLEDAMGSQKFWRLWKVYESEAALKGVMKALTDAFGLGLQTATVQMLLENEALRRGADSKLRSQLNAVQSGQTAVLAAQHSGTEVCMQRLDALSASLTAMATACLDGDTAAKQAAARDAIGLDHAKGMADTLQHFDKALRDHEAVVSALLPDLEDPVTRELMVDPVKCSDGETYCRFSAFNIIDSRTFMPGCMDDKEFSIAVDDLKVRKQLFAAVPAQFSEWQRQRAEYVASVAANEAAGNLIVAQLRAERALAFLPRNDSQVPALQATIQRIEAVTSVLTQARPHATTSGQLTIRYGEPAELQQPAKAKAGANLTGCGSAPDLYTAAKTGRQAIVAQLLAAGANVHQKTATGWAALHVAAYMGHIPVITQLLAAGANLDAPVAGISWTALHIAAQRGQEAAVRQLLDAGSSVDSQLKASAATPLQLAAEEGHAQVVQALLAAGASTNAIDGDRMTALHWAAKEGHADVATQLLAAGARVDSLNARGWSPLHLAAKHGKREVAKVLLAAGADPHRKLWKWCFRRDAVSLALTHGHARLATDLRGSQS